MESALGRSPENLRQEADAANHWSVVEDELRAMLKGPSGVTPSVIGVTPSVFCKFPPSFG
jgi:hypothetical protein